MVVGIRGLPTSGKSEVGIILAYAFNGGNSDYFNFIEFREDFEKTRKTRGSWEIVEFSDSLKRVVSQLFGFSIDYNGFETVKDESSHLEFYYVLTNIGKGIKFRKVLKVFYDLKSAERYRDKWKDRIVTPITIMRKTLTWREVLAITERSLHTGLGEYTFIQDVYDLLETDRNIIITDVSKPEHINLIHSRGGVIVNVHRNFIVKCTYEEAIKAFRRNKKVIIMDYISSPTVLKTEKEIIDVYNRVPEVKFAIDTSPPPSPYDNFLAEDSRWDFVIHNPVGNVESQSSSSLFENVMDVSKDIMNKLLKN